MYETQVLVYVQAIPVLVPLSAKSFQGLETSDFTISHSSKKALALAKSLGLTEIVAMGFPPVLHESLARGASRCITVPLCDDPLEQASFFPKDTDAPSQIIVGENSDWVFTGASLAGVLAESRKCSLYFLQDGDTMKSYPNSIIVVRDSGENAGNVDARRIESSFQVVLNDEALLGGSTFSKPETRGTERISGNASEIVSLVSRKLKRIIHQ